MPLSEQLIEQIAAVVDENGYWGDGAEIFKNLGLPPDARADGGVYRRTRNYLQQADDPTADAMLKYFEFGPYQPVYAPWPCRGLKLFISHRDDQKAALALLRQALELYGIASFLAHEAIEIGTVWRAELEAGLKSMEALFAYCSRGFSESDWTGQEVGYGFGKDVPVLAVMAGEHPKGLLEQVQAAKRVVDNGVAAGQLAELIFSQLKMDARTKGPLSEGLARQLKFAGSFDRARFLAQQLLEIGELTDTARRDMLFALEVNTQAADVRTDEKIFGLAFG